MHRLINGNLDFNIAVGKLALDERTRIVANRNLKAHDGDYWQEGRGYLGPLPNPNAKGLNKLAYGAAMLQLARVFCAENIFLEVVSRQVSALLAQPPLISFERRAPSQQGGKVDDPGNLPAEDDPSKKPAVDPIVEEAQTAINEWLNSKRVRLALARVFARRLLTKHGALRLFVPPRFSFPEGVKGKTLADILNGLGLDEPTHEDARVIYDPDDGTHCSFARFGITDQDKQGKIEVGFTDDIGQTFIGVLTPGTEGAAPKNVRQFVPVDPNAGGIPGLPKFAGQTSSPLSLHGHLLTYELIGPLLTTEQVWQNACGIALCLTMANHVTIENGFSEMVLTNVDLPVEEIADSTAPDGVREEVLEIFRGAGTVNNFEGVKDTTEQGEKTATPGVHWKEASPITTHVDGVELHYLVVLREVRQLHAAISGDATASGESRKQALKDFADATTGLLLELNDFGQWLIETALYLGANILNRPDFFDLRGRFEGQISAGSLSTEEEANLITQVEKNIRSKKGARNKLGIFDDEAEERQIQREAHEAAEFALTLPQPEIPVDPNDPNPDPNKKPAPAPGKPQPIRKPAPVRRSVMA